MVTASDNLVKTYSRRLLAPFSGQVQLAETGEARALSLDGRSWEIQYLLAARKAPTWAQRDDRQVYQYVRVAGVGDGRISRYPLHHLLDAEQVSIAVDRLGECLMKAMVPFPSLDVFEYWLLDGSDQTPLALISACISADEITKSRVQAKWIAMPAAQLAVKDAAHSDSQYVAPVNYRLQKLIERRAGKHPQGAWFERIAEDSEAFPACLLREDWDDEEESELCQRYIARLAPRLLTLQGLPPGDRSRLEQAARENALEVDQFYSLYPKFIDEKLIKSMLVEAKMRRAVSTNPGIE